jgi:hypothetical protein
LRASGERRKPPWVRERAEHARVMLEIAIKEAEALCIDIN